MLVVQNAGNPSAVLDEIGSSIPALCTGLFVASAYVTREGTALLFERLRLKLGAVTFARIPKRLVTTFDYGLTDPDGLEDWIAAGAAVFVANADVVAAGSLNPAAAYHPKVYGFRSAAGLWSVVAGSANLTGRGMTVNAEAVATVAVPDAEMSAAIALLSQDAAPATSQLLAAYSALRAASPPPPSLARLVTPVSPPATPAPAALYTLWEAIAAGMAVPSSFDRFWVQTLAPSGGSGSQIELPRGAHEFFGFVFFDYEVDTAVPIGMPRLRSGLRTWTDRILSYHGDNGMERLNMPTPAMSGFSYGHSAVSFRRRGADFDFEVAPWNSSLANASRSASTSAGTLFRLGGNSPRVCGFV
jgi:hypothetical protein